MSALCFNKGVTHATADNKIVYLVEQVFDNTQFRAYFRTTDDGRERMLRVFEHVIDSGNFFFHEETQHLRVGIEVIGDNSR